MKAPEPRARAGVRRLALASLAVALGCAGPGEERPRAPWRDRWHDRVALARDPATAPAELGELLREGTWYERSLAAAALETRGDGGLKELTRALDGPSPDARAEACLSFGGLRAAAEPVEAALVRCIADADAEVRLMGLWGATRLAPDRERARLEDALVELLLGDDASLRSVAVRALAACAPAPPPRLLEALAAGSLRTRSWALTSLEAMGPRAAPAGEALVALVLEAEEEREIVRGLRALAALGPQASTAAGSIAELVSEPGVGPEAVATLRAFGPAAFPALLERLVDGETDPAAPLAALRALAAEDPAPLAAALGSPRFLTRRWAVAVAAGMPAPLAPQLARALTEVTADPHEDLRAAACRILVGAAPDAAAGCEP